MGAIGAAICLSARFSGGSVARSVICSSRNPAPPLVALVYCRHARYSSPISASATLGAIQFHSYASPIARHCARLRPMQSFPPKKHVARPDRVRPAPLDAARLNTLALGYVARLCHQRRQARSVSAA